MHKVLVCGLDTAKLPKITNNEANELLIKIKTENDEDAKNKFVMANLRLVLSLLQRFDSKHNSDDLFQVGVIGLMKAVNNFDLKYNVKFSTYAVPMIIGEIKRFLKDCSSVKVPRSARDIAYKALQARETIEIKYQRMATLDEIAEMTGYAEEEVACALNAVSEPISIYENVFSDEEDSLSLIEQLFDKSEGEDMWNEKMLLKQSFMTLTDKERAILKARYYLDKTQMQIADKLGVSQAQVSRLEKLALRKMKALM
ncbi:MAG: sigma-70 family RNA polymerase sigma factor [Clostridia bacterium]|nr:sigma-70 family RNA polymerase sigma factor [Clostridia bacterium]